MDREKLLAVAIEEAREGRKEGGIPIGSVLVDKDGVVVARGHNMRVQVIQYGFLLTISLVSCTPATSCLADILYRRQETQQLMQKWLL